MSSPIHGIIDRSAPVKFGKGLMPASSEYLPGEEISATFNEDIDCSKPFSFAVSINVDTTVPQVLTGTDLNVYCETHRIFIEISPTSPLQVCWLIYYDCRSDVSVV